MATSLRWHTHFAQTNNSCSAWSQSKPKAKGLVWTEVSFNFFLKNTLWSNID